MWGDLSKISTFSLQYSILGKLTCAKMFTEYKKTNLSVYSFLDSVIIINTTHSNN